MQLVTDPAAAVGHGSLVHGHDGLLSPNLQYEQVASTRTCKHKTGSRSQVMAIQK